MGRNLQGGVGGISDFPSVAGRHRRGALHDRTTARHTRSGFAGCGLAQSVALDLGMHLGSLGICRRHPDRDLLVFVTPASSAEQRRFANPNAWARDSRKMPRPVFPAEAHPIVRMHRMSLMQRRLGLNEPIGSRINICELDFRTPPIGLLQGARLMDVVNWLVIAVLGLALAFVSFRATLFRSAWNRD